MRRHDLDWLRVLLFGLLVVHHAAVGFAPFGADIYGFANDRLGGELVSLGIYWSHTWRLPALFLISGVGTWFASARGAGGRFIGRRLLRLLVPALFGTFVLNLAAGIAIERATGGDRPTWEVVRDWYLAPEPQQVMHLWFLYNLALYTLLSWPLLLLRNRLAALPLGPGTLVVLLALVATAVAVALKPHAAALAGDGYQFAWYGSIFAAGYGIGAHHRAVLAWAARWWSVLFILGLVGFSLEIALLASGLAADAAYGQALASGGWAADGLAPAYGARELLFAAAEGLNAWLFSLAAFGLAARFLNRPGGRLAALTRATFPIYVLHFPLTIVGMAILASLPFPWPVEFLTLAAGTYLGCYLMWRLLDRPRVPVLLVGGRHPAA